MAEEVKGRVLLRRENFVPFVLLLLIFPPVLRGHYHVFQKGQLLIFLFWGIFIAVRGGVRGKRAATELILLFVLFPVGYAAVGAWYGYSGYVIVKELLFFVTPFTVFFAIERFFVLKEHRNLIVWFGVGAAITLILVFLEGQFWDIHFVRSVFRWRFLYMLYPVLLPALWILAGDDSRSSLRKWLMGSVLMLGIFSTLGRRDLIGAAALLVFYAGGFYRSVQRMRLWILALSLVPIVYFLILNHGVQLSGKRYKDWRVYEVQTFVAASSPEEPAFWVGHGLGWELVVKRNLHVYASDVLSKINKFHDFWLYLLSKGGLFGTLGFWLGLLWFLLSVSHRLFLASANRFSHFMLAYLSFICFVAWNYNGGPAMAFQQGALFAIGLALAVQGEIGFVPEGGME